jgi:hypothetical protein
MNPEDRARPGTAAMKLIAVGSRLDAKKAGHACLVIDGTLIPIDRVAPDRPFYSGKHRKHRMNLQVIASPDGDILWVSGPLHGAVHDADGPARDHTPAAATGRNLRHPDHQGASAMLRHTFVTTIRCRRRPQGRPDRRPPHRPAHTMRYERARQNLDRHPNCFLAAYMAFDT